MPVCTFSGRGRGVGENAGAEGERAGGGDYGGGEGVPLRGSRYVPRGTFVQLNINNVMLVIDVTRNVIFRKNS